jgi:hypothetical protein
MLIQNGRTHGSTKGVDQLKIVSIDDLDLVDFVADAARILLTAHPEVLFTSGRRTVEEQASAMAANVIKRRKWIEQTYVKTVERDALQYWIDGHPEARTQVAISAGLETIMSGWSDDQKIRVSLHFCGHAFDVQPVAHGDAIKKTIQSLPNLRKFLESEGGLVRWHADFVKS